MISVVLPTRGFVFTEVENAIQSNLAGYEYKIHRSFNLPIPDGHNELAKKALEDGFEYLLFVEEDVVLPDGAVDDMIMAQSDIACIDYGVQGWGCVTRDKRNNSILWCGLGCTLVKREVLEKMEYPYFRTDKALRLNDWPTIDWVDTNILKNYGGLDIWFCMKAKELGFRIKQVQGECRHLKLEALGQIEVNQGLHNIINKPKIVKNQAL